MVLGELCYTAADNQHRRAGISPVLGGKRRGTGRPWWARGPTEQGPRRKRACCCGRNRDGLVGVEHRLQTSTPWGQELHLIFFRFIYFERERESVRGRERERGNPKQALYRQHRARRGAQTPGPRDHDPSRNQASGASPTEPPRRPRSSASLTDHHIPSAPA